MPSRLTVADPSAQRAAEVSARTVSMSPVAYAVSYRRHACSSVASVNPGSSNAGR
jgi:hypothetical protein